MAKPYYRLKSNPTTIVSRFSPKSGKVEWTESMKNGPSQQWIIFAWDDQNVELLNDEETQEVEDKLLDFFSES